MRGVGVVRRRCAAPPARRGTAAPATGRQRARGRGRRARARRGRARERARRRSEQRRLEALLAEVRRVDVDEQRAQRADALAHGLGRPLEARAGRRRGRSSGRPPTSAYGDAGEVLHHAVVEVAGDRRRSTSDASSARCSSASRSRWRWRSRRASDHASGICTSSSDHERAERDRGEAAPQPRCRSAARGRSGSRPRTAAASPPGGATGRYTSSSFAVARARTGSPARRGR